MLVIHASDLHLGHPLWALPVHAALDLDAFRHSAFRTLGRLVDLCLVERADFLLLAGDLIEGAVRNYKVGLRLVHELSRLEDAGTQVAWVRGNHDAENRVIANLLLPSHVTELGLSGVQTKEFADRGVMLVGRSYDRRACCEDLLASYPPRHDTLCTIGLLHTSGDGAITGDRYAPCRRSDLTRKGYDYLALGHVHQPTVLSERVAYSGCLQGRSFLESGARGCQLVRVSRDQTVNLEHRSLEVVRFGVIVVDVSKARSVDQVVESLLTAAKRAAREHPERALVARLRIVGAAGVERLLVTSLDLRKRALREALERMPPLLAVDGCWIDLGHPEVTPIRVAGEEYRRVDLD
jgi:DNA repair protein SbcD/Mre11